MALGGGSMHYPANELLRIPLPRTSVNKARRRGRAGAFSSLGHDALLLSC
jgi:hypothetical protein